MSSLVSFVVAATFTEGLEPRSPVTVTPAVPFTMVTLDDADGDAEESEDDEDPHAVSTRAADRARAAAATGREITFSDPNGVSGRARSPG